MASIFTNLAAGGTIVAVIVEFMQVVCVSIGLAIWALIGLLTGIATGDDSGVWSIKEVLFNRSSITTASFFHSNTFDMGLFSDINYSDGIVPRIFEQVSRFYYIMRNVSIAALLFILLYIGIRMAISTVASEEAKYKKMLGNWATSMALIFVLHFIIIGTLFVNNKLVTILYPFANDEVNSTIGEMAVPIVGVAESVTNRQLVNWSYVSLATEGLVPIVGIGEAITFVMIMAMELNFVLIYIKRVITLAFLIVIAPLITITYSIDKVGDNRSQALDTWLKEYMFTVLIQPFHCIIYIVLIQTALNGMAALTLGHNAVTGFYVAGEGIGVGVIYIIMLKFMKDAEDIVRKIFGIRADSLPGFKTSGVMALGVMSKLGSAAGKGGKSSGGGSGREKKMPDMKAEQKAKTIAERGANNNQTGGQTGGQPGGQTGGQTGGQSGGQSGRQSGNAPIPPQPNPRNQQNNDTFKEISGFVKNLSETQYGKQLTGIINRQGGVRGVVRSGVRHGAQLAGFGFGLGLTGELDQAAAFSMLAGNTTDSIDGAITEYNDNKKLEKNEEVFKEELYGIASKLKDNGTFSSVEDAIDYLQDFDGKYAKGEIAQTALGDEERELIDLIDNIDKSYAKVGEAEPDDMRKSLYTQTRKNTEKYRKLYENRNS